MQGEKEKRLSYMKCANCGTELKDGTLFCPVCKSEIQWVPEYHTLETILLQKQMREKNLKEKKQKKEHIFSYFYFMHHFLKSPHHHNSSLSIFPFILNFSPKNWGCILYIFML